MRHAWLMALILLPTAAAGAMLPAQDRPAPDQPAEPQGGGGCLDTPVLVDECGDTMTGDLNFQPLTNVVLASRATIQFPAGALTGESPAGLAFEGDRVCLDDGTNVPGCGDIGAVQAGFGLVGGGTGGEVALAVDTSVIQRRVQSCGAGEVLMFIGAGGGVMCSGQAAVGEWTGVLTDYFDSPKIEIHSVTIDCPPQASMVVIAASAVIENLDPSGGSTRFVLDLDIDGLNFGNKAQATIRGGEVDTLAFMLPVQCGLGPRVVSLEAGPCCGIADFRLMDRSLSVMQFALVV